MTDARRAWLRPTSILFAEEYPRQAQLEALYDEMLAQHASPNPSPVELLAVRQMVADLWQIDRETGDAADLYQATREPQSYRARRSNVLVEADHRLKVRKLLLATLKTDLEVLELARGAAKSGHSGAIPLRKAG
jgi:hypothetical protein